MDTIILRFRDTKQYIDTIFEHNQIVNNIGYVWWGWWKKAEESSNEESLDILKSRLENGDKILIGLFDKTTSRFYKTNLIDLKFDFSNKFNSPEKSFTPDYYNNAELYCWFKISKIDQISEADFVSSFAPIPLENETFYSLPIKRILYKDRIQIDGNYILHLSDIHFGLDFGFPEMQTPNSKPLINRIKDYFEGKRDIKIGLVIVSGDITTRADGDMFFGPAIGFFNELCSFFSIRKEQIVFVPGNHDIPLHKAEFLGYTHEETFKAFLKEFYQKKKELSGLERFITADGIKLDVLRINSIRLRKVSEKNFGYVGWDDYNRIMLDAMDTDTKTIKIAVLHHHLLPVPNEELIEYDSDYGSISVTVDSGRVLEGLQKYNFNLVLHGHQHLPGINKVARGVRKDNNILLDKGIYLIGAGSTGAKADRLNEQMRDNSFTIIKLENTQITIEALRYNKCLEAETLFTSIINIAM